MTRPSVFRGSRGRSLFLGVLLVVLASQIYISLYSGALNISVAIVLLPVLAFLSPEFPVLAAAALSAPGVFLLRLVFQWFSAGTLAGAAAAHAPEMLFYLTYGLLFWLYLGKLSLRPVRLMKFLPLAAIDACSNFVELLARLGGDVFTPSHLLQLLAVGACRSLLAWAALRTLDAYSLQVLRREDAERYQRLLLMTATLKSEVAWMDKGTALIEDTMNTAYRLYSQLRSSGGDSGAADAALTVAKDIHEVKKEYFLIMRGISEALDTGSAGGAMELEELMRILEESTLRSARASGKEISFTRRCADHFATRRHHYLMSIFRNLLNNAVEAAAPGVPARLSFTEHSEGRDFVFQVADSCGGIPESRLSQIFTPGFSSKINYATGEVNRGLGLAIVRELAEDRLKGSVTVACRDGGTVFTVRIPKTQLEETAHASVSD